MPNTSAPKLGCLHQVRRLVAIGPTASLVEERMASGASRSGRLAEQAGQATRLASGVSSLVHLPRLPRAGAVGGATAGLWRAAAHKQAGPGAVEATRRGRGRSWGALALRLCQAVGAALIICCSPALNQAAEIRTRGKPSQCVRAALGGAHAAHGAGAVAGTVGRTVHLHGSRGWGKGMLHIECSVMGCLSMVQCRTSKELQPVTAFHPARLLTWCICQVGAPPAIRPAGAAAAGGSTASRQLRRVPPGGPAGQPAGCSRGSA